jgi:hypothetical protein
MRGVELLLLIGVIAMVLNGIAVYFLPAYAYALGQVPGAGALVRWSGLSANDIDVIYATAAHNGVRLSVTAGFADENHTLLTIEVYGPRSSPGAFDSLTLTDQFGHSYAEQGFQAFAVTNLSDGGTPDYFDFSGITGPAAVVGARLTLTATNWRTACACDAATDPNIVTVPGTWQVTFVITPRAPVFIRWAPATVDGLRYSFPSVSITDSKLVEIVMDAQGAILPASIFSGPGDPPEVPAPQLEDADGRPVKETVVPWTSLHSANDFQSQDLDYVLQPGTYRLTVYGLHGSSVERELIVR